MRRRQYIRLTAGASSALMAGLAGCNGQDGGDGSGDGGDGSGDGGDGSNDGSDGGSAQSTMELWHDKGQNPNWNPAFDETVPVINEQQDAVTVEATPYQSTDGYQGALRPVLGAENGPGIFSWWTGARLRNLVNDGYALDVTDVWQEHVDNGEYSESMIDTFGTDGSAYSLPLQTSYWSMWYNTETFDELGISPPSTWAEFEQLCEDILSKSGEETTPIAVPLSPSWTGFMWFEEFVARQDPDFYQQLCRGEAAYTDETSVTALETIGEMQQNGYFGKASESFSMALDDLPRALEGGDYAMTLLGDWFSTLFGENLDFGKYDWFELPPMNDGVGKMLFAEPTPLVPHSGYPDEAAVKDVADAVLSTEVQEAWAKAQNVVPANAKVDTSFLPENKKTLAEAVASGEYSFPLRYWENTSPDVAVPAGQTLKRIHQSPGKAQAIAKEVDKTRQEVYGSN